MNAPKQGGNYAEDAATNAGEAHPKGCPYD